MQRIALLTGNRASVFWGRDLARDNRRYLEGLDGEYFAFAARQSAEQLSAEPPLERADQLRVAISLRLVYGQAEETLMALLCALSQAPTFPLGWMLRYQNQDLLDVVQAIDRGRDFPNLLVERPVTWRSLSAVVHGHIPDAAARLGLVERFANFWARMASAVLSSSHRDEYNAHKHGLRVLPGGFSVAVGVERVPGRPAATEDMQSLGGSAFGSSFTGALKIDGAEKHHLRLSFESRNWSWEALAVDLQLMAKSIANVVSCLRVIGGTPPDTVRFSWPQVGDPEQDPFVRYRGYRMSVERLSTAEDVQMTDIAPVSPAEVRRFYDDPGAHEQQTPPDPPTDPPF